MELDFNRIERIRRIRKEKSALSEEETKLSVPTLVDRSQMLRVKEVIFDILKESGCPVQGSIAQIRRKFVFVVLYLYSPSTLAGGKMPDGLRESIASALGIQAKSSISNDFPDTVFQYEHYTDFRSDVHYIYDRLIEQLRNEGVIS